MFSFRPLVLAALLCSSSAFQPVSMTKIANDNHKPLKQIQNAMGSLAVAGTILTSSLLPAPAQASVELSEGAIIVQTSTKPGQSLLKTEVEAKDLAGSVIKNRKALKESLGRIAAVVKEELSSPVYTEIAKEILQIEADATPDLQVLPPRDPQQTLRDVSKGKLNLIVNGEIINLSIEKTSAAGEDEIVIRAKGVKGVGPIAFSEPAVTQVRTRLQDQIDAVLDFWYSPVPVPDAIAQQLPDDFEIDAGTALVVGATAFVGGVYGVSYAYYLSEQEAEAKRAAENKAKLAAKKKAAQAKAAAKKKAEEEESS